MNRKSLTLPTSRHKFHRLRHLGGTMAPNKAQCQTSGTQNYAFEADEAVDSHRDNSTTVPEVTSPMRPSSTKGNVGNVEILGNSAELLVSAAGHLRSCADCLKRQFDAAHETTTLVSQSRLFNIQKLNEAMLSITEVIEPLQKSLSAVQDTKPEKIFTPVLINTLTKESTKMERISKSLSTDKADTTRLDQDLREIRTAILRGIEAFEPVRQAVFRPDRRGDHDYDRVGNQTREYLRTLDIYWLGLRQAREALPNESKLPHVTDMENEPRTRSCGAELSESGSKRYWPV